jgi:hypothetical protein
MSIITLVVLLCTSPFGWIAGQLSEINRRLPFGLNVALYGVGIVLAVMAMQRAKQETVEG